MKERPILFKGSMVRAVLDGSKTNTRRIVKRTAAEWLTPGTGFTPEFVASPENHLSPYGFAGDRLWVRESLGYDAEYGHFYAATVPGSLGNASGRTYLCSEFNTDDRAHYSEDYCMPDRGVPSIHLPRRYSRITLDVTHVRIERLQAITEADALAEGVDEWRRGACSAQNPHGYGPVDYFRLLWESINGQGSWDADPYVWVIGFKRLEQGA